MIDYSKIKPVEMLSPEEVTDLVMDEVPPMIYKLYTDANGKRGDVKIKKGRTPKGWAKFTPEVCDRLFNESQDKQTIDHEVIQ